MTDRATGARNIEARIAPADSPTRIVAGIFVAFAAASALVVSGCNQAPLAVPTPEIVTGFQADDVPVPRSFQLDENEFASWADIEFQDPPIGLRSGKFTYFGDRPVIEIARWYSEQMPTEGWKQVDSRTDSTSMQLSFEKQHETCEVKLEEVARQGRRYLGTKLVVRLRPTSF